MFKLCPSSTLLYSSHLWIFPPFISQYKHDSETQHSHSIMEYLLVPNLYGCSKNFKTELTGI